MRALALALGLLLAAPAAAQQRPTDCGTAIRDDGRAVPGSVDERGQNVCYTLAARAGVTYHVTADLNGLDDSILSIVDQSGSVLAENDDADDEAMGLGSSIDCKRRHSLRLLARLPSR